LQISWRLCPAGIDRASPTEGNASARDYSEATAEQIGQEVRKLLDRAYQFARTTLMANGDKLDVIAKALPDSETLDGSQIEEILEHGRLINPPPGKAAPPGKKRRVKKPLGSLGLTARETEVLNWIAQGKTNHEIGVILSACTRTSCLRNFWQAVIR
jgi:DNA-binding NarL/FixJ family response regulator